MIKIRSFDLVGFSVLIYTVLLTCFDTSFYNSSLSTLFCLFAICVFLIGVFKKRNLIMPFTNNIDKLFFWFFIFWSLITVVRGVFAHSVPIGMVIKHRHLFTGFLIPLVVFIGIEKLKLKWVFQFCFICALVGIACFVLKFDDIIGFQLASFIFGYDEYFINLGQLPGYFAIPAGLILLTNYAGKKYYILVIALYIVGIFTALVFARRSFLAYYLIIILMSMYNYYFLNRTSLAIKVAVLLLGFTILGYLINIINVEHFGLFFKRLSAQTRGGVEDYFFQSMKFEDWIFGRGVLGQYYCPIINYQYRYVIETGFLQLILKGGVLLLIPYLYFLLKSFVLGFFYSNNLIIKGMAAYSLFFFVVLYPGGFPFFDFRWLLLWVCFLYCNSKKWRMMSNQEILKFTK